MNIQSFLEHHGIVRNPFAEEDAQTDPVFKEHCISSAYHPVWDKVYGDPAEPSTAIVFGPKGSGKTAMRLQIDRHLMRYNQEHPERRVFVIRYDDFNPFLDHFSQRLSKFHSKKPEKVLDAWKLWDHMDSILCLAMTDLVDRTLASQPTSQAASTLATTSEPATDPPLHDALNRPLRDAVGRPLQPIEEAQLAHLDRTTARDFLLLAALYDQSTASSFDQRWNQLRKRLGYGNWAASRDKWLMIFWAILTVVFVGWIWYRGAVSDRWALALLPLIALPGIAPYGWRWLRCQLAAIGIGRHLRVGKRDTAAVRRVLLQIPPAELASQPLPRYDRTDDRYELLNKLQGVLTRLGFAGTIVLMDRVDEPHLTGGQPELMRRFVWPLLDNKLLKHPGLGFKLMLPRELYRDVEREGREFHERARLDKQNVVPSFQWTGESLYDLTNARMLACTADGRKVEPKDLFGDAVSYQRLLTVFQSLRVPRHLFRFLFRVLAEHCNRYTDAQPKFQIDSETFESVYAVFSREIEPTA